MPQAREPRGETEPATRTAFTANPHAPHLTSPNTRDRRGRTAKHKREQLLAFMPKAPFPTLQIAPPSLPPIPFPLPRRTGSKQQQLLPALRPQARTRSGHATPPD